MSTKRQKDFPCLKCEEHCKKGAAAIQCNLCDQWAHPGCAGISEVLFKELVHQYENNGGTTWSCRSCRSAAEKLNKKINEIYKKVDQLEERTVANENEVSSLRTDVSSLEKKVEEGNKQRMNIAEESQEAIFAELKDREVRKCNLVFHNVPEPDKKLSVEQKKERDSQSVQAILRKIKVGQNTEKSIKFMRRLGDLTDKPRPLLIGMQNEQSRAEILKCAWNLDRSNNISIIPDLTARQRKEEEKMRKEVERKNKELSSEDSLNYQWRMVGLRGERRIVRMPRRQENPNFIPLGERNRGRVRQRSPEDSEEEQQNPSKRH